jgi:hypothetical protein
MPVERTRLEAPLDFEGIVPIMIDGGGREHAVHACCLNHKKNVVLHLMCRKLLCYRYKLFAEIIN